MAPVEAPTRKPITARDLTFEQIVTKVLEMKVKADSSTDPATQDSLKRDMLMLLQLASAKLGEEL